MKVVALTVMVWAVLVPLKPVMAAAMCPHYYSILALGFFYIDGLIDRRAWNSNLTGQCIFSLLRPAS
jgi:hypothetical protein